MAQIVRMSAILALVLIAAPGGAQTTTPAPTPPTAFSLAVTRSGYLLGPGDSLKISVFEYEEYSGNQVILPDGTIALPVLGTVMAAERTPEALAQEITARLKPYLKNPIVSVSLTLTRPVRINVAGAVQRPGPIQLRNTDTTGSIGRMPTVSTALQEAGGISRDADIRKVVLRRYVGSGEGTEVTLNLWEAISSEKGERDMNLQDGDSLFVPKLSAAEVLDHKLLARSSLAPKTVRVRVVGEVKKPGEVEVLPDSTIASAVAVAGGPTDKAALDQVAFSRLGDDGRVASKSVNLSGMNDDNQVQAGDVIVVPKSGLSGGLDFLSAVLPFGWLLRMFSGGF